MRDGVDATAAPDVFAPRIALRSIRATERLDSEGSLRRRLHQSVELAFHVQLSQLAKATYAFAIDDYLRHGARAMGDARKFAQRILGEIDADLVISDTPFIE